MSRGLVLAATALVLSVPVQASESQTLAQDEGRLLLGTGPAGIGNPNGSLPATSPVQLHPVSHTVIPFTTDCARGVIATVTWTSLTNATLGVSEHALLQAEIRDANGTVHASTFADDGRMTLGTEGMLDAGDYELHLFHLLGDPVRYNATVEGKHSPDC